jgi:glycosyltransferase involved in cell wall biosynthesis
MSRPLRLLSIGHSYVVALNRRLPHEVARVSNGRWEVTAVAPQFVRAELRDIAFEPATDEMCRVEPVALHASRHPHVTAFGWRLRELLRQNWDLVHVYQEPYIVAGWQSAYWTPAKTPLVFYTAQNIAKRYPPPFSWMEQYCLERCAAWIGCGETIVRALVSKGYDRKPHTQIGFGVDMDAFRPNQQQRRQVRQELEWDDTVPVISFLGRLVPVKGLTLLTSVLDELRSPWRMLFIGKGPLRPELERWATRYSRRVRFVSPDHKDVPRYLNAADLLCAPSQTMPDAIEQFGRMITEAFAVGVPVVGSDSGEVPYVIGDGGVVVGEKDTQGWVNALDRLLLDESLRAELSAKGRQRAAEHFAWPVIARKHLEFFEEILAGKPSLGLRHGQAEVVS